MIIIADELKYVLENIPILLQYYVPGYWMIFIFRYFGSKKISNHMTNVMACIISYIFISIIALLRTKCVCLSAKPDTPLINSAIALIIGTISGIIVAIALSSECFSKVTVALFNKTPNEDIWKDVLDLKKGSNLKIYIKNEEYYVIGHHKNHEEKGNDSWLAISAFAKYDKKSNKLYNNETYFENDESVIYTIRFSDIDHIEIF